jgi:hypothetical protein
MGSCEHEEIVSELRERRESDEKGLVPMRGTRDDTREEMSLSCMIEQERKMTRKRKQEETEKRKRKKADLKTPDGQL